MRANAKEKAPTLAPPGAGLPWVELLFARLGFAVLRRRATRATSTELLWDKHEAILELTKKCDEAGAARQVLVRRLPGMEDSSRFWSVFMTVEHLCIVNMQVAGVIQTLGEASVPPSKANTADVKPQPGAGPVVVDNLRKSCNLLECVAMKIPDLHTKVRFAHPWFGPIDASDWYFMAGFHMGLHLKQIELILRQLDTT